MTTTTTDGETDVELLWLPLDSIDPDPDNIRGDLGDLTGLAASIAELGVQQPIVVMPATVRKGAKPRWDLIIGHRRHGASKKAKKPTIPALVRRDLSATDRLLIQAVENLQRVDLNPIEEARTFERLVELQVSQRDISAKLGRAQSHVSKRRSLLELPDQVQQLIAKGEIPIGDGLELARLAKIAPDRVMKAVRHDLRITLKDAVTEQLKAHDADLRGAASVAELAGSAMTVKKNFTNAGGYYGGIGWYDLGYQALTVDLPQLKADEHDGFGYAPQPHTVVDASIDDERKAGHLAVIISAGGRIVHVCTKPSAHRKKAAAVRQSAAEKAEAERRAEAKTQRAAASTDRRAHIAATIGQRIDADHTDLIVRAVALRLLDEFGDSELLAEFFGLADEKATWSDCYNAVEAWRLEVASTATTNELLRIAAVIACLQTDKALHFQHTLDVADIAAVDLMAATGLDLADVDTTAVDSVRQTITAPSDAAAA